MRKKSTGNNRPDAAFDSEGYGIFRTDDGSWVRAHEFMWFIQTGVMPKPGTILQTCGERTCVNPAHLVEKANPLALN